MKMYQTDRTYLVIQALITWLSPQAFLISTSIITARFSVSQESSFLALGKASTNASASSGLTAFSSNS
jgi:hypothetical protein